MALTHGHLSAERWSTVHTTWSGKYRIEALRLELNPGRTSNATMTGECTAGDKQTVN
jgi:hypothetical protein